MSSPAMVPMIAPDGTAGSVPQDQVQAAVAAGGKLSVRILAPDGTAGAVPMDRVHDALNAGGQLMGEPPRAPAVNMQPDYSGAFSQNRFTITPQPGEDFNDTMQRAAQAGQTVTPEEISSQGWKGIKESPAALAAAPAMGFAGAAGIAGLGELAGATFTKVPGGRDVATGRMLPWVEQEGKSLLRQGTEAVVSHLKQPGTILKLPFGRAIEYYALGKLGLSKADLSKVSDLFIAP
jgi:hypothetical protein